MKGIFNLNWTNIKSALVYGFLTLVALFVLSALQDIQNAGTVFGLDWKSIVDKAIVATIPAIVVVVSLVKNLLTNNKGEFLGAVTVIPETK